MASSQIDNILASTAVLNLKDICDNWYKGNSGLEAVMGKGITRSHSGGRKITTPLIVNGNDNIGSYAAYDALSVKPTEEFGYAEFPWRQFYAGLSTCGYEECINGGDMAIFNLVEQKMRVLKMSLTNKMSEWFYTSDGKGNNSKDPYGLPRILGGITQPDKDGNTAPIYPELGGLDPTDPKCAFWSAYIDDGGYQVAIMNGTEPPAPRPLTQKLLYETYLCIGNDAMNDRPDCILMSKDLYTDFVAQLQPQVAPVGTSDVATGITGITWYGVRIVWDPQIPDGTVIFLNTNYLYWEINSNCYMKMRDWITPVNQDAKYTHILSMANLTTCNRSKQGLLCNVRPLCAK